MSEEKTCVDLVDELEVTLRKALGDEVGGIAEREYSEEGYTCENFVMNALGNTSFIKAKCMSEINELEEDLNKAHRELTRR